MKSSLLQDFNKLISFLQVRLAKGSMGFSLDTAFAICDYEVHADAIYYAQRRKIFFSRDASGEEKQEEVPVGRFFFVPKGHVFPIAFQEPAPREIPRGHAEKYMSETERTHADDCDIIVLYLSCKVFDALDLFSSLKILPFVLPDSKGNIRATFFDLFKEMKGNHIGKARLVDTKVEHIVVHVLRDILDNNLFVQEMVTNGNNLVNGRLVKLAKHIKDNLKNDLSNRELSEVVGVSEDYIGQYFKKLTDINPQNYVELLRMEQAVYFLRNTDKPIYDVGRAVGYKDNSYFCRRFKMMFGICASEMRRRHAKK